MTHVKCDKGGTDNMHYALCTHCASELKILKQFSFHFGFPKMIEGKGIKQYICVRVLCIMLHLFNIYTQNIHAKRICKHIYIVLSFRNVHTEILISYTTYYTQQFELYQTLSTNENLNYLNG